MTGTPLDFHEIEQIKVLKASGKTFNAISQEIKRDPKTVKKACLDPVIAEDIKEIQEELADAYEGLARRMLDSITDQDVQKINAYQRTIASGICTDKMRLLRNESTENFSRDALNLSIEARQERIIELEVELSEMTGEDISAKREALREKVLRRLGKPVNQNDDSTINEK